MCRGVLIPEMPEFLADQTCDCVMLADAHITDMINIPAPQRNSYSEPCRSSLCVLSRNDHPFICLTCVCQLPRVEVSSPPQLVLL